MHKDDQPSRVVAEKALTKRTRVTNLRKGYQTTVENLAPGDTVTGKWNSKKGVMRLLIQSANGVVIRHHKLTEEKA